MYTCAHCREKFSNQPFISYSTRKKYCSLKCLPDSAMDRPYSFQYFNLVENLRDMESRVSSIATLEDRLELEEEVNEMYNSYVSEVYGDDEGLFYKKQIILLLPALDELYDKIHNIFMERENKLRTAVIIALDTLVQVFGEEHAQMIFIYFDVRIEMEKIPYENAYGSDPGELGCFKDKLCVNTSEEAEKIKNIYHENLDYFKSLFTKEELEALDYWDDCIAIKTLAYCEVCHECEP